MPALLDQEQIYKIVKTYTPLLVLYPEIKDHSERKDHYHAIGEKLDKPPLDQDCHFTRPDYS